MAAPAEEESETRLCSNCKKDIPGANFTIHEIHCSRNIGVCPFCQESIPKSEMQNHMEMEHTQVTCKCSMKMERGDLPEHKASACPLRPVACQHCDLELAFHKLQDHVDYCGTRTEQCSRCSRNVMLKDLKAHPEDCGRKAVESQEGQAKPCLNSEASLRNIQTIRNILHPDGPPGPLLRANRLPESRLHNCLSGELPPMQLPRRRKGDLVQPAGNQDRLEKSTNALALGGEEPDYHLDYLLALSLQRDDGSPHDRSAVELPREFWKNLCPTRTSPTGNPLEANAFSVFRQDTLGSVNPSNKSKVETLLPCEFCEELYPEEDLILHQTGCSPASVLASFSKRSFSAPRQEEDERLTDLWEQLPRDPSSGRETGTLQADSGGSVMIPCEFCGVQLEEEILFHHQDQCDLHPATGRVPPQPEPPAKGGLTRTDSSDLPRRRVRHQGEVSPQYLEEFRRHRPPQPPVQQSHPWGPPLAARRLQLNPLNNRLRSEGGTTPPGPALYNSRSRTKPWQSESAYPDKEE